MFYFGKPSPVQSSLLHESVHSRMFAAAAARHFNTAMNPLDQFADTKAKQAHFKLDLFCFFTVKSRESDGKHVPENRRRSTSSISNLVAVQQEFRDKKTLNNINE